MGARLTFVTCLNRDSYECLAMLIYISPALTGVASAVLTNKNWFFLGCTTIGVHWAPYVRTVLT